MEKNKLNPNIAVYRMMSHGSAVMCIATSRS
ncbi:hypothetical protein CVT25_007067 [Psilocybe cyanescens]|uniref:Uncharacterized protein n=1 Tax=Psilocybe cyanescens TaxID=93625 RepID=A0A409WYB3_PSICY|nr:hypothetical protein CVT25_007067 [Psilocybe cyanescens]